MFFATRWRSLSKGAARDSAALPLPADEARLLVDARPNLLLIGPEELTTAAIAGLTQNCERPLVRWREGKPLKLLEPPRGTLVLRGVSRLTMNEQQHVARWLDFAAGRVQVLSTTADPLFELVESGQFLDVLYYRLNVVRLDLPLT